MSIADDIVTVLEADTGAGGVATLLTGGIYTFEETGRLGLNPNNQTSAFDSTTGKVLPSLIVKERALEPDNGIWDDGSKAISYRQIVELWFYNDGVSGKSTLESARARAFTVLHAVAIGTDKCIPRWAGNAIRDARDPSLDYACILRDDYEVRGLV